MRFPEFSEPWEQKNIGTILTIGNGKDYRKLGHGDIPVFGTGGYIASVNDCLMDGESVFIGRKGTINKPFYYKGKFWTVDTLFFTHTFNGVIPKFVLYLFENINWLNYNEASGVPSLSKSSIEKIRVNLPHIDEQSKIVDFLGLLDRHISVQNKIIEDLRQLKSALVERLYGQHNPNYRIGDLVVQVSERNRSDNNYSVLSVNNRLGFIEQSEQFEDRSVASDDTSNYKVVSRNDFAYNPARINVGSIARLTSYENGIVSPMYICFHTKKHILPQYLEHFFNTCYFQNEMQKRLEGSVRLCLSWEGLCNIPIAMPPIEQQEKVGKRISLLADKIELEVSHLNLLNTQKQYLLQAMFI